MKCNKSAATRGGSSRLCMLALLSALALAGCDWLKSPTERVERAREYIAVGNDRGALIELQNAVKREPTNIEARLLMTEISLRLGDPSGARKEIEAARANGGGAGALAEVDAQTRLAAGQHDELAAEIEANRTALVEPARTVYLARAKLQARNPRAAHDILSKLLETHPESTTGRIALAESLTALNDSEGALRELEAVVAREPKNALALLMKGTMLSQRGDHAAAIAALEEARANTAGNLTRAQVYAVLATKIATQLASGDLNGARATQEQLASQAPDAAITSLMAARVAMASGDHSTALSQALKVIAVAPNAVPARLVAGAALLGQGNINQAETQLAEAVRIAPDNTEARNLLAQVNLRLRRPEQAIQALSSAPDQAGSQRDALLALANLQQGDSGAAIELLERSVAANPQNPAFKLDLAAAYLMGGESAKALELLKTLPASDPRRRQLLVAAIEGTQGVAAARAEIDRMTADTKEASLLNLGAAFHLRHGDYDRARTLLQRAVAADPAATASRMSLARLELVAGNEAVAVKQLQDMLAADPANHGARLTLAELAWRKGDLPTAHQQLEAVRKADPKAAEARLLLARLHFQRQQVAEGEAMMAEALDTAEDRASIFDAAGRLYLDQGRFDDALRNFRKASERDPRNVSYLLNAARAQVALGNDAGAREAAEQALRVAPSTIKAHSMLALLDIKSGRSGEALVRAAQLRKTNADDPTFALLEGDVAHAVKAFDVAERAYAEAIRLKPSREAALRMYVNRQTGKLADARAPLIEWLGRNPADAPVRVALADSYLAAADQARAIEQYERIVRDGSSNPVVLNNLAWLYHERKDGRALDMARRAHELAPQVPAIADTYGWILLQSGDAMGALPILQKAAASSKQPDMRYHHAVALARTGDQGGARRELEALLQESGVKQQTQTEARQLLATLGGEGGTPGR